MRAPLLRYALVGVAATATHYAVLVALVEWARMAAPMAAALRAWLGAQVAFAGNARYTFAGAAVNLVSWLRFQGVAAVGAAVSFGVVATGQRAGLHYLLAQMIATVVAMLLTYELNRRWSFAPPTPSRR